MGGIMKGGSYSSRRRWVNVYVVMVLVCVVLGCGVLGLHRLKERRVLNLLIKQKHQQIVSLHHLLQKEREHVKQAEMKTEEMKVKIFNLRSQKTELNNRVIELQSTISSLRDEHQTMELAFRDKENEIKVLRDQYMEIKDQKPRLESLTEVLRQKESEIENLKQGIQTYEHLNPVENVTGIASLSGSSMESGEERESRSENQEVGLREVGVEKLEKQENSHNGRYKFRGKNGYNFKQAKGGKRWKGFRRNGAASTLGGRGSVEGAASTSQDRGSIGSVEGVASTLGGRGTRGSVEGDVSTSQGRGSIGSFEGVASTLEGRGSVEWMEENGDGREEGKSRNLDKIQNSTSHQILRDDKHTDTAQGETMSNVKGWQEMQTNSSSEKPDVSVDEQSKEQETGITEQAESNGSQRDSRLEQNEVAERNEDGVQNEHLDKSELGEDTEEKEEADEQEF